MKDATSAKTDPPVQASQDPAAGRLRTALVLLALLTILFALALWYSSQPIAVYNVSASASSAVTSGTAIKDNGLTSHTAPLSPVNVNTATEAELQTLPGVGPVLAGRIVAYREEYGGFREKEELREVPGIGEKTYRRIEPYVTV